MTSNFKRTLLSSVAAAAVTMMAAGTAQATNGYFSNGYGTASKGMSGVSVANPQDTQAAANNPAGMRALGNRFDAGISVFSPRRSYETTTGGFFAGTGDPAHKSSSNYFLVPSFGANWDMGEYSLGVTMTANGGMNTDYATNVFNGGTNGRTGIDLAQALIGFTYSRDLNSDHTIGITPTLAAQRFKATGLQGFGAISSDATKLTDNGYDYSYGGGMRLGWLGKMNDKLTLGAMAQSKMYMQKFDKYAGLFANKGEFDIPATVSIGASYKATDKLTVSGDAQRIFYGSVDSISNTHNISVVPIMGAPTTHANALGASNGVGFGWQDMDVFKVGLEYAYSDALTLRTGASHNTAAFSNTETLFNVLAPAVVNTHLSVGGTYEFAPNMSFSMSYTRAFTADITGVNTNNAVALGGAAAPIALEMNQHDLEVGFKYNF